MYKEIKEMTDFYYDKYYKNRSGNRRAFIFMTEHKIDLERLRNEVEMFLGPLKGGYGVTTTKEYINENPPDYRRFNTISAFDEFGERRYPGGERDEDITCWPSVLENSYMKELGDTFSDLLKIYNPRVRMSVGNKIPFHTDPHTPYRIHIALEAYPDSVWVFRHKDGTEETIFQPADGIPALVETGETAHSVKMLGEHRNRIHLFYQFHGVVSDEILSRL